MEFETYTYRTEIRIPSIGIGSDPGDRVISRVWTLRKNTQDEFIVKEVYESNCYRLPDDLTGKVIVDIGANIGAFAAACVDRGAKCVYCFEPFPDLATKLFPANVVRSPFVVVGDSGPDKVFLSEDQSFDNTLLTGGVNTFGLPTDQLRRHTTIKILEVFRYLDPDNQIWIKLDCEGSEYEILASDLPWGRMERIFGECHTLIDGKLSRDTAAIENGRFPIQPCQAALVLRLESVGYRVTWQENPDDEHLHLFWAENQRDRKEILQLDSEYCGEYNTHDSLGPIPKAMEYAEKLTFGASALQPVWDALKKVSDFPPEKIVAILTPFRNARRYLPLYFRQLTSLRDLLSQNGYSLRLVAAEGDSLDGTRERISQLASDHNIPLTLVDTTHGHMRWASVEDPVRMKVMSDVMNKALDEVKESDSVVVWIMSDLEWTPSSIFSLIKSAECEDLNCHIFAPVVLALPGSVDRSVFYDTWAFRGCDGERFRMVYPWHRDLLSEGLCEISSAGTCLAMKGQVARDCRASNEEAVSFCCNASAEGYSVAIDLRVSVVHAPKSTHSLLWISDAVCLSGFSRVAHAMFPQLVEAGFDVEIIAQNYFGTPHNFPYTIWPANVNGDDPSGALRMQNLLWNNRVDGKSKYDAIIVLDDPWNMPRIVKGIEAIKELDKDFVAPLVIAWVTVDGKNIQAKDLSDTHVVCSTYFGLEEIARDDEFLAGNVHFSSVPASVIPFGVDVSIFQPLDKLECRKLTCGDGSIIPYDSFIVGTVSSNQLRKNLHLVLESFSDWVHRYNRSDAYLYLCLSAESETGCDIDSLARYYDLRGKVITNKSILSDEMLAKVYNSFDVFISLSNEGFGLCALEAMSCGVPCVLTDWSGYSSWVPDDAAIKIHCPHTQLTAPLNSKAYVIGGVADKGKVVAALQKLYTFPEMREKLSVRGQEVAKELSWKNTGDKLIDVIEKVIEREAIQQEDKHGYSADPTSPYYSLDPEIHVCNSENGCGLEQKAEICLHGKETNGMVFWSRVENSSPIPFSESCVECTQIAEQDARENPPKIENGLVLFGESNG
jgi:FkbM family methyltransferase